MFHSALRKTLFSAPRPAIARASIQQVAARGYHEKVISHYEKPRNVCLAHFKSLDRFI
jgi:hypothetical protein